MMSHPGRTVAEYRPSAIFSTAVAESKAKLTDAERILVERVPEDPEWDAARDRLQRAAATFI
ncbi:MAG: hypothetical protein EBR15_09970 [Gammaproteobacteria bacterium]|nr:hypothetical protein [Gammaproteobacteria bacterium]